MIAIIRGPRRAAAASGYEAGQLRGRLDAGNACELYKTSWRPNLHRELRGSQGMGVVRNSWFDCVLLSIIYMCKPSC